jgi:4-amino-4-deoxy-L-arabinose transferase-like glycosyltransferase
MQMNDALAGAWTQPSRLVRPVLVIAVAALTVIGFWIRVYGLGGWDGTLTIDESRLAMAARGVLDSGLPRLPSGWVYTRGLLVTYLTAPSLALLGETDFAARLPSVVAGSLLIPVAYLLGREVSGRGGGLFVAAMLAGHPSFVVWSRQAWFYAVYVLFYAGALLFIVRAHRTGRLNDVILAAALTSLTAYAHEVGIFLLLPLVVQLGLHVRSHWGQHGWWIAPTISLAIVGVATVVLWALITRLRAESLVGAYGEVGEYLSPSVEISRVRFYLRQMIDGPGLVLAAALVGAIGAVQQRRTDTLLLWLALLPTLAHAAFLIPRGPQERYGLTLILVVTVLGAQGITAYGRKLVDAVVRRSGYGARMASGVVAATLVLTALAHQDVARAIDRAALSPNEGSWLRLARELGIGPDDIVMTDVPTVVGWYIGGLDFWVSSRDYEKYTLRQDDVRRDVHTGAVLIRSQAELERFVMMPLAGKSVWLISSGRSYQWGEQVDDNLKSLLERSADQRLNPGDNFRILSLQTRPGS